MARSLGKITENRVPELSQRYLKKTTSNQKRPKMMMVRNKTTKCQEVIGCIMQLSLLTN
jgi:hypothetical protein